MNVKVFTCSGCGAPLPASESQSICVCRYCQSKFHIHSGEPPAVTIIPHIDAAKARAIVDEKNRHPEISAHFLTHSHSIRCELYFVPFFEVRGVKTGMVTPAPGKKPEFSYQSYHYLEPANDLRQLGTVGIPAELVENALLKSETGTFDPVAMRKKGAILPPKDTPILISKAQYAAVNDVEHHHRLVYFPIWEVSRIFRGILFKSFISAVDGAVLEIQSLRSQNRKLFYSLFSLFCLAVLLGRGLNFGGMIMPYLLLIGGLASLVLLPYLWEVFAFQEMVFISAGGAVRFQSVNYTENSMVRLCHNMIDGIQNMFEKGKHDE